MPALLLKGQFPIGRRKPPLSAMPSYWELISQRKPSIRYSTKRRWDRPSGRVQTPLTHLAQVTISICYALMHVCIILFLRTLAPIAGWRSNSWAPWRTPLGREDMIQICLMDRNFDMSLTEWCTYFGFVNNDGHIRFVDDLLWPPSSTLLVQDEPCKSWSKG